MHGGHVTKGEEADAGFENWRKLFERQAEAGGFDVPILIENTAGGDNAMARRFDTLARLWDAVGDFGAGFCLDTCHAFAAGEDLVGIVERVKAITGRIDLVHLNSSRDEFNSARDRHANIADGTIEPEQLVAVLAAAQAPAVVETPDEGQAADIEFLRAQARRVRAAGLALLVLLCGCTLVLGYANKARCTGPTYDAQGRTTPSYQVRRYRDVCYSDIQHLWLGRQVDRHVFPYVDGGIDSYGELTGGAVEYPVLTGLLMWAGAWFADNDGQYLFFSALLLAPFGLLTASCWASWRGGGRWCGPWARRSCCTPFTTGICRRWPVRSPPSTACCARTGRWSPRRCWAWASRSSSIRRSSCCRWRFMCSAGAARSTRYGWSWSRPWSPCW
ncbi:hypothetical protein GCM10018954_000700 [Kutzneria kofuensis]